MSNSIIPPLLSDSPPPIATNLDEDYDDEFGDFTGPGDLSFDNDVSTPSTPKNSKHFVKGYSPFKLNEIEQTYEQIRKSDDKSTKNFIRNELPTKTYINILDHIENNSPKIVNRDKEDIVKVNNETEEELKNISPVKRFDQSTCEENNEDNFPKNGKFTKSFEEVEGIINDQLVDSVLIVTHNNSNEKSDSSDENDIKNKTDNVFSEVPFKKCSSIADEIFHDSKDYFEESSTSRSVNFNENIEIGVKEEKARFENGSHIDVNSIDNFNYEENLTHLSKYEKTTPDVENETLNSSSLSTFSQHNVNTTETGPNSEISDNGNELGCYKNTFHNLKKEDDEVHEANTKSAMLDKNESSQEILPPNLTTTGMGNSKFDATKSNEDDDFGEFADFKTSNFESNINVFDVNYKAEDMEQVNDDFGEFGNFINCGHANEFNQLKKSNKVVANSEQENMEPKQGGIMDDQLDEFDDFTDYSTFSTPKDATEDDLDEFSDYSTFNRKNSDNSEIFENTIQICKGPEEAFKVTQSVMDELFMPTNSDTADYTSSEITVGNPVFENLKDITETNALMYQWEKSTAQKNILKTLNIDIRNILYGPTWNSGIPIFAANLCSTPLEPIKSEVICSLSPHKVLETPETNCSNVCTDVPLAEFDWNGAGLTNPLDSFEEVEKQLETSDLSTSANDENRSPSVASIAIASKLTDYKNNASDKSLQLLQSMIGESNTREVEENVVNGDDFGDFSSYQPNYEQGLEWTGKMLPLRESHISYQPSSITEKSLTTRAIIKPSIESSTSSQNFDLNFLQSKPDHITSSETAHVTSSSIPDYSDLKLFSQIENTLKIKEPLAVFDDFKSFKTESNLQQQDKLHHSAIQTPAPSVNIPVKTSNMVSQNTDAGTVHAELYSSKNIHSDSNYHEDEFTDFHSFSSNQPKLPLSSSVSFPEPLKPAVLQPVPVNKISIAKIQWPEPGLDEHEINRIIAGCIRRNSETERRAVEKKEPVYCAEEKISTKKAINPQKSVTSNDDDEWSDFVSVKEPVKSRTATPDLPLSVFNLGTIQPVKAPTPVVTQNGLICSPAKNSLPNMPVPKSNFNLQRNIQHLPRKHPFITSQAFDALYQNPRENITAVNNSFRDAPRQVANQPCSNCGDQSKNMIDRYFDKTSQSVSNIGYVSSQNGAISYGKFQNSSCGVPKSGGDDDEWGDFVSATNAINPYSCNPNPLQSATRILSNPSHFMRAFNQKVSSEQYSSSNRGSVVRQERQNIPSISAMPDLDFVSPRTKSVKK